MLDYIETQKRWKKKLLGVGFKKYLYYFSLIPNYIKDKEFCDRIANFRVNPNKICFEREIMDHFRFVLEKI